MLPAALPAAHTQAWPLLATLYYYTIAYPTMAIYLNAPVALGGWGGKTPVEICSSLTHIDATFWFAHFDACQELIERKTGAFVTWTSALFYLFFVGRLLVRALQFP